MLGSKFKVNMMKEEKDIIKTGKILSFAHNPMPNKDCL